MRVSQQKPCVGSRRDFSRAPILGVFPPNTDFGLKLFVGALKPAGRHGGAPPADGSFVASMRD